MIGLLPIHATYGTHGVRPTPAATFPNLATRAALATLALVGTAAYAATFRLVTPHGLASADGIAIAAGAAWLVLMFVLWTLDNDGPGDDIDLCLVTITVGMVFLAVAASTNFLLWLIGLTPHWPSRSLLAFHAMALGLGQVAMAAVFIVCRMARGGGSC